MLEGRRIRLIQCPQCRSFLPELSDHPIYKCGGCNATLQGNPSTTSRNIPAQISEDKLSENLEFQNSVERKEMWNSDSMMEDTDSVELGGKDEVVDLRVTNTNGDSPKRTEDRNYSTNYRKNEGFDPYTRTHDRGLVNDGSKIGENYKNDSRGFSEYVEKESDDAMDELNMTNNVEENRETKSLSGSSWSGESSQRQRLGSTTKISDRPISRRTKRYTLGNLSDDAYSVEGSSNRLHMLTGKMGNLDLAGSDNYVPYRRDHRTTYHEADSYPTRNSSQSTRSEVNSMDVGGSDNYVPYRRDRRSTTYHEADSYPTRNSPQSTRNEVNSMDVSGSDNYVPYRRDRRSTTYHEADSYPTRNSPQSTRSEVNSMDNRFKRSPQFDPELVYSTGANRMGRRRYYGPVNPSRDFGYGDHFGPPMIRSYSHAPYYYMERPYTEIGTCNPSSFHPPNSSFFDYYSDSRKNDSHVLPLTYRRSYEEPEIDNIHLYHHDLRGYDLTVKLRRQKDTPFMTVPRKYTKRMCKPITKGAPFFICYNCFEVLQLPSKIMLGKENRPNIRCASCDEITLLVLDAQISTSFDPEGKYNTRNLTKECLESSYHAKESAELSYPDDILQSVDEQCPSSSSFSPVCESFNEATEMNSSNPQKAQNQSLSPNTFFEDDETSPQRVERSREYSRKHYDSPESPLQSTLTYEFNQPRRKIGKEKPNNHIHTAESHRINTFGPISAPTKLEMSNLVEQMSIGMPNDTRRQYPVYDAQSKPELWNRENQSLYGVEIHSFDREKKNSNYSRSSMDSEETQFNVIINGQGIPHHLVKQAEKKSGPISPGNYWYDYESGFWGLMGHPCMGILLPYIEEFNYPILPDCSNGNTSVFVNGRQLHEEDFVILCSKGLPDDRNRRYLIDFDGIVIDEKTGEELLTIGCLAPTVSVRKVGFGMRLPRSLTE